MTNAREEMVREIEEVRERLNQSIDQKESYGVIYQLSVKLDELLNQYVAAGF